MLRASRGSLRDLSHLASPIAALLPAGQADKVAQVDKTLQLPRNFGNFGIYSDIVVHIGAMCIASVLFALAVSSEMAGARAQGLEQVGGGGVGDLRL